MICSNDHAAHERLVDQLLKRLPRPARLRERFLIPRGIDLVGVDALFLSARDLRPERLALFDGGNGRSVPAVVQVGRRHFDEKEHIEGLGRQYQTERLIFPLGR